MLRLRVTGFLSFSAARKLFRKKRGLIMTRKKSWFFKLFTVFAALSIMAWGVLLSPVQSAKASRSNQGTNTDGEWSLAQTTANLITIHEGSLTEQGWNINGEIKRAPQSGIKMLTRYRQRRLCKRSMVSNYPVAVRPY